MTEQFLTVKDLARLLRSNRYAVQRGLRSGRIPGIKILGRWRIPKGELQRWMDEKGMRRDIDYVW